MNAVFVQPWQSVSASSRSGVEILTFKTGMREKTRSCLGWQMCFFKIFFPFFFLFCLCSPTLPLMMLVLLLPSRSDCRLQFSRWQAGMRLTRNQTRGERVLISCGVKGHSPSVNSNSFCLLPMPGCCTPDSHIASCLLVLHIYNMSAVWWSLKSAYKYFILPTAEIPVFLKRLIRCCYALFNILICVLTLCSRRTTRSLAV